MKIINAQPARGWKMLGMGKEFTKGDKVIYIVTYTWIFIWTIVFIFGTIYSFTHDVSDSAWLKYWKYYVYIYLTASALVIIWFTIGGVIDLKSMFKRLKLIKLDETDDGFVRKE